MSLGAERTEHADITRYQQEIVGHLAKARALLALAQRHASRMPLAPEDQEKSRAGLAEAIGLCVTATRLAKSQNIYRIPDSGLNASEIRNSVERAVSKTARVKNPPDRPRGRAAPLTSDPQSGPLLTQLDACRRMNMDGLRWLGRSDELPEGNWRGNQLLKIAEQLCVITAMESKLLGVYVMGESSLEPAVIRKAVNLWATETTRRELAEE